jgi:hypothetical protein
VAQSVRGHDGGARHGGHAHQQVRVTSVCRHGLVVINS